MRCPVTLMRHEAIPSRDMGPATMGRKHRRFHTEGLPKSASETTAHKITQADESHRMGTRTKSLGTMSTIMPNSFGRIRGACCARNACKPTYALGASWPRRRQTSQQYLTPPDFTTVQTKGVDINPDPCHKSSSQPALHRCVSWHIAVPGFLYVTPGTKPRHLCKVLRTLRSGARIANEGKCEDLPDIRPASPHAED